MAFTPGLTVGVDPFAHFRRRMLKTDFLKETDEVQEGVPHKRAKLYTFAKKEFDNSGANFKFH